RAGGDARLVLVESAVVALGGEAAQARLARRALAEAELLLLVEAQLEERRIVELMHLDGVVRASGGAQRATGAGVLLDEDLLALRVERDRVEVARIDAARVGAGVAGVDEVEIAQDAPVDGQTLDAVAIFARLFARLALDAGIDLAHAQRH